MKKLFLILTLSVILMSCEKEVTTNCGIITGIYKWTKVDSIFDSYTIHVKNFDSQDVKYIYCNYIEIQGYKVGDTMCLKRAW